MSTVILDTITGKSTATTITIGSTPVVSASANSMTIRGEGSAQTSIQQGLAKAWAALNGSSFGLNDSFNITSATDNSTGNYTVTYTNNFASANNCPLGIADNFTMFVNATPTSSTFNLGTRNSGNVSVDSPVVSTSAKGDLA